MTKVKTYRIEIDGEPTPGEAIVFGEDGHMSTAVLGTASDKNVGTNPGDIVSVQADGKVSPLNLPAVQGGLDAATYDPDLIQADVFDMDNMKQGTDNKFVTPSEKTALEQLDNTFDTKVDKTNNTGVLYGTSHTQHQVSGGGRSAPQSIETTVPYTTNATANTIAQRNATGALTVSTPSTDTDAATKKYVDDADETLAGDIEDLDDDKLDKPTSGIGAPTIIPDYVGQQYVDLENDILYVAKGNTSTTDWIKGGGDVGFEEDGYYPKLHAGLADNLYTNDAIHSIGSYLIRTTAGDESITTGDAEISYIQGNSVHTGIHGSSLNYMPTAGIACSCTLEDFEEAISTTGVTPTVFNYAQGVWDVNPETYGFTVTLQTYKLEIDGSTFTDDGTTYKSTADEGTIYFVYQNSVWNKQTQGGSVTVLLENLGINTPSDAQAGDTITVTYLEPISEGHIDVTYITSSFGTITNSKPTSFVSTGVNQWKNTYKLTNVNLDGNGVIISDTSGTAQSIAYAPVVAGVTNGYFVGNPSSTAMSYTVGYIRDEVPAIGKQVTLLGSVNSSDGFKIEFPYNCYLVVMAVNGNFSNTFQIHPARSGQQDSNTDQYSETTVSMPTQGTIAGETVTLPIATYGMPRIGNSYDELNFTLGKYIKRVDRIAYSEDNLETVEAMGVAYDYDDNRIYYEITPVEYTFDADAKYTANDYGTERIIGAVTIGSVETIYGTNLKDKLRSDVLIKGQQTLTAQQKAQVLENLGIHVVNTLPGTTINGDIYITLQN